MADHGIVVDHNIARLFDMLPGLSLNRSRPTVDLGPGELGMTRFTAGAAIYMILVLKS